MSRSPRKTSLTESAPCRRRGRYDTPKVPGLREQSQNQHRATTRPIWHAQSAERVARGIRWDRFDTHKVPRGLREGSGESDLTRAKRRWFPRAYVRISPNTARTTKNEHRKCKMWNTIFFVRLSLKYGACHKKWTQSIWSTALATWNHHHVPNPKRQKFHKRRFSSFSKHRPSSPNIVPARENCLRNHFWFGPAPANVSAACRKWYEFHAD